MFLGVPSGRPLMLLSRDSIFVHSGGISMKLATDIHNVIESFSQAEAKGQGHV